MNWLRGDSSNRQSDNTDPNAPEASTAPDANELRRRRLAKLEEAQAADKARRKDLEERKAKWMAEKAEREQAAPPPPSPDPAPVVPKPVPAEEPAPKRQAPALPTVEKMQSDIVAKCLGIALTPARVNDSQRFFPQLVEQLREDARLSEQQQLLLDADMHVDDILLNRLAADEDALAYTMGCYTRCGQQYSQLQSNRRLAAEEHKQRRARLLETIKGVEKRVMLYTGMLLNDSIMTSGVSARDKFYRSMLDEKIPSGFIRSLLTRFAEEDGPGMEELEQLFLGLLNFIRDAAVANSFLSSSSFLKPYKALASFVSHKELCRMLTSSPKFLPKVPDGHTMTIQQFNSLSILVPFFRISALPGLPLHQPRILPEDLTLGRTMFPNPTLLDRTEAEGTIFSLRSSLSVARSYLHQICLLICKAGLESRNAMLEWFGTVLNFNKTRSAMQVDYRKVNGDGFMLNLMHVLLKLCDPIVMGGWKMLQKVDPTYPQSKHRINYEDETRLAADTDMLKRWWVDKRNENAQESLARQLEVTAREAGMSSTAGAGPSCEGGASDSAMQLVAPAVSKDFSFVTECFWLAMRSIHLGFIAVENMYEETLRRSLHRLKEMISDMERAQQQNALPANQEAQLVMFKRQFDNLVQAKLCYDVYLQDNEMLTALVRFVTADAEWLMKKILAEPKRESLLPLPLPPSPVLASLPEHTVETITTVLLSAMRYAPQIVDDNSALLEDIVSFCIAGAASPLHVKNPYLRAKLVEFLSTIFPKGSGFDDDDEDDGRMVNPAMEGLFASHELSRRFLPGALFRLYVDVEHTGSHTQFYDKFTIRYRIGSIIESLWYMEDYRKSVRAEARDETRFLRFVNMVLNDGNHLLDSVLDDLEEMHMLQMLMRGGSAEWEGLTDEEKVEKQERLQRLEGMAKSYNQLANNNVKLLWLLTEDKVVRRIFLRDEMVSRIAEMLNYLLDRLCGQRCRDLAVSEPEKVSWKPRQLLTRIMQTYLHFDGERLFAEAVGRDGRSYKKELFERALKIGRNRKLLNRGELEALERVSEDAARALQEDQDAEVELGEIPDEFLDPIMSSLMRNPVRLPTSGNIMDRAVISRILLSDKVDPFNRKLLTEDMLEDEVELKARIEQFVRKRRSEI